MIHAFLNLLRKRIAQNLREAYEIEEKGFSIYDRRNNTTSNYFFGKIGIDTREEAENIISRLTAK